MNLPSSKSLYFLSFIIISFFASLFLVSKSVGAAGAVDLLPSPWHLTGNNGAAESYKAINSPILQNNDTLRINYNLHGLCSLNGDASAIILDQSDGWHYVSLSNFGKNCYDGVQTVDIKLSDFPGLNINLPINSIHSRFWYSGQFTVDINSIQVLNSQNTTNTPTSTPTPTPTTANNQLDSFTANYWNNSSTSSSPQFPTRAPDLVRQDTAINFNWGSGSPDSKIKNDRFLVRWTKTQSFISGAYRFISNSDDGIRVWLDGDLLIDQWNDHALKVDGADRNISAGNHQIKVEYYENGGDAVAKLNITSLASVAVTPTQTPTNTPAPVSGKTWDIQSVSSMKETKDKICGQDDQAFIEKWVDKAKELGVNYIAVETPYDNPSCGNSLDYTQKWIDVIRSRGLKVWHRHMFTAFEGIYGVQKVKADYLTKTAQYIKDHPNFFAAGDIFTPQPEPQNGGIQGFTGCDQGVCQYSSIADFNKWLRDAIDVSNQAFSSIGLGGQMKIGYYGFDGFITWGSNNPDWHGILEDATVQKMGNITIDHYPELIGQTMDQGLKELQSKYPNTPIIIGEWGSAGTGDVEQQVINSMGAAKRPGIVGFNYWHMGMGGNEALVNSDFTNRPQFKDVQAFFTGQR